MGIDRVQMPLTLDGVSFMDADIDLDAGRSTNRKAEPWMNVGVGLMQVLFRFDAFKMLAIELRITGKEVRKGGINGHAAVTFGGIDHPARHAALCVLAIASVLLIASGISKHIPRSPVTQSIHIVEEQHLLLVDERHLPAEHLQEDAQRSTSLRQMWREHGAIGAIDAIALALRPEVQ